MKEMAARAESLLVAVFLGAVVGGVVVGTENGASVDAALFEMRYMLFFAAFSPALSRSCAAGNSCSSWSGQGSSWSSSCKSIR